MTVSIEVKEPDDLSAMGKCGINYALEALGESEVERDAAGNITYEAYSFTQKYTKVLGCHQVYDHTYSRGDITRAGGDPQITPLPNGGTRETVNIRIRGFVSDLCGPCYNPGNLSIGFANERLTSSSNSGAEAKEKMLLMRRFGTQLEDDAENPIGLGAGLRLMREWYKMFVADDDSSGDLDVESGCTFDDRHTLCDFTP